jgi:hypothetical protein
MKHKWRSRQGILTPCKSSRAVFYKIVTRYLKAIAFKRHSSVRFEWNRTVCMQKRDELPKVVPINRNLLWVLKAMSKGENGTTIRNNGRIVPSQIWHCCDSRDLQPDEGAPYF